jgi:hypothetical protein
MSWQANEADEPTRLLRLRLPTTNEADDADLVDEATDATEIQ